MSKVVIYVLDKIVWMLLITAVTTQALQIAGVVDAPKGLGDISYKQDSEYNFQVQVGNSDVRGKRQTDQRSPLIDNIFSIPITTLNAVNNLVQNTRPAFQSLREFAARRFDRANKAANKNQTRQQRPAPVYVHSTEETVNTQ
ncbi:uncharacterized protein LOC103312721 isoform X1 [Tribolium castaneum]|uniref:Uncharacterized protein n=1 Tax=Tribolium castaneum TaxID=7070 RepID=A0A139WJ42_TRICA|nr:PREDICTED: uncharacterized protein LOC103312721 isoform X1 [Tribolium castaneum]KYB28038.1 hypothetical protein TcasGA2_TC007257 [Tribolium castaneum]|eukprot:XP_008192328.1 PREDICTED: uncharacterized protein LOC103312721 isoform X1 [Tribolium castaneum]